MEWPVTRGGSRQTGRQINHLENLKCWGAWAAGTEPRTKTKTSHCLEERGAERWSAWWSSLKGQKRNAVNQVNTATSTTTNHKGNAGETSERWGGVHNIIYTMGFFECTEMWQRYRLEINWTRLLQQPVFLRPLTSVKSATNSNSANTNWPTPVVGYPPHQHTHTHTLPS